MKPLGLSDCFVYPAAQPVGENALWMLHGAGGNHQHFLGLARLLKPVINCVPVDLPGHGRHKGPLAASVEDNARALLRAMDETGVDRAVLCGHSMGGGVALSAALLAPERISALVLLGSGAKLGVSPALGQLLQQDFEVFVEMGTPAVFAPGAAPALVASAKKAMALAGQQRVQHDFELCGRFDIRERVSEITCPVLVLCGEHDTMTPPRFADWLGQHLPRATVQLVPGAGHMLMLEAPALITQLVGEFLATLGIA